MMLSMFRTETIWSDLVDLWFQQMSRIVTKASSPADSLHLAFETTTRISDTSVNKFLVIPWITSTQPCSMLTMEYQSTLRTLYGKHKRASLEPHREASTIGDRKLVNFFDLPKENAGTQVLNISLHERILLDFSSFQSHVFLLRIILPLFRGI